MRILPHVYEQEGVVYDKGRLKIIAIVVDHGELIKPAYAFRAEYKRRVFVHSHETRYNENLIAQAHGADVFVLEAKLLANDRVLSIMCSSNVGSISFPD